MKKYIIFDLDGTLIDSSEQNFNYIFKVLEENFGKQDEDYIRYFFSQTAGTPLYDQLVSIFSSQDKSIIKDITNDIYKNLTLKSDSLKFFPGIIDMIKKLEKNYQLFLSTGSGDNFAVKILKNGKVFESFTKVLGSSNIGKSPEHIKIFKDKTLDEKFEKFAVYIGDGNTDREIAKSCNIDFIKVGKTGTDKYEVEKTIDVVGILKTL